MKRYISIVLFIFVSISVKGQQDPQFTQYIFNQLIINPAYAGSKEIHNICATYSAQWAGFNGAPNTETISYDGPIARNMGLGVHFINDIIGAQMQQGLFGSYSYQLRLTERWRLSFGLALGFTNYTLDGTKLVSDNPDDPAVPKTKAGKLRFDSKFGIFAHNDRLYGGFSITNLFGNVTKSEDLLVANTTRHYYLTGGYIFDLPKNFKLKPSIMIKEDFKSPTDIDLTAYCLYKEKLWLGLSLRGNIKMGKKNLDSSLKRRNALAIMAGWNIIDRLRIGYAYTVTLTSLKNYSGHEIELGYYFPSKVNPSMKTPRYF